jgi:hypothetical protein
LQPETVFADCWQHFPYHPFVTALAFEFSFSKAKHLSCPRR